MHERSDSIIELRGLGHHYGGPEVLRNLDLAVAEGEVFGFLGHNGAGKTTTIHVLTTLITPTSGAARVCGFDVVEARLDVQRNIGYLPENVRLYDNLSAAENLGFFAKLSGVGDIPAAIDRARQRIGIAQAILRRGTSGHAYGLYHGDGLARDRAPDRIVIYRDTLLRDFGHDLGLLTAEGRPHPASRDRPPPRLQRRRRRRAGALTAGGGRSHGPPGQDESLIVNSPSPPTVRSQSHDRGET